MLRRPQGRTLGDRHHHTHVVVEFTDFFCPHCQEAHAEVMAPLIRRYVPTGRVRVESHPVAFLADESMSASHAALCAQEQHKYWEVRSHVLIASLINALAAAPLPLFLALRCCAQPPPNRHNWR